MKSSAAKIQMTSYEELFETGDNADSSVEKVLEIPLSDLYPFKNHPFKVLDDEAMQDTVESIKAHGVLVPGIRSVFLYNLSIYTDSNASGQVRA